MPHLDMNHSPIYACVQCGGSGGSSEIGDLMGHGGEPLFYRSRAGRRAGSGYLVRQGTLSPSSRADTETRNRSSGG